LETANRLGLSAESVIRLGLAENQFYAHGSRAGQMADAGIDAAGIAGVVRRAVKALREAGEATSVPPRERRHGP
jgi:1-deoxy-D-xylulose-5-phosphate synthase